MKISTIIIIIAVFIFFIVLLLAVMGFLPLKIQGFTFGDTNDGNTISGAEYCGFSDGQILDMLETLVGKDLNNEVGLGFVDALNMKACGSDTWTLTEVRSSYISLYSDYYVSGEEALHGSGWDGILILWGNDADYTDSTMGKAMIAGSGTAVKEMYGYNTIALSSSGTTASYVAFSLFLNSS